MKLINPLWFFISLSIGILLTYLFSSEYKTIIKYPHPSKDIIYKDLDDTCYKYVANEIKCPSNDKDINEFKIQH